MFITKHTKKLNDQGIGVKLTRENTTIDLPVNDLMVDFCDHLKNFVSKLDEKQK